MAAHNSDDLVVLVGTALQGQGGQLQPGDPALRACFQVDDVFIRKGEPHQVVQESGRLFNCEPQVGLPYLRQLSLDAQASQWHRWIGPGDDDYVHPGWDVVKQKVERSVDSEFGDNVVVIQD